jgi:hypothetical protein
MTPILISTYSSFCGQYFLFFHERILRLTREINSPIYPAIGIVVTETWNDPQRPTTTHNDPTTTHYDPQRPHNDPLRPNTIHNDPQRPTTIHNDPTTTHYDPQRPTTTPLWPHNDPTTTHNTPQRATTTKKPATTIHKFTTIQQQSLHAQVEVLHFPPIFITCVDY